MATFKQQICDHRKILRQFQEHERIARDFLLLCTPQSTISNHQKAIAEMIQWQKSGSFESQGRAYPFRPHLLRDALLKMYEEPAFVPESTSNPERPLRYLKKIMVRLLEHQAQQQRAAGVQTVSQMSSTSPASFVEVWCTHAIQGLQHVNGLDVRHLIARVEEIRDHPELFHDALPQAIDEMLLIEAQETLGELGMKQLHQEVTSWFAEHQQEWTAETFADTVAAAMRERLRERFRLPSLAI